MDSYSNFLQKHLFVISGFLVLGLISGFVYSLQFLGFLTDASSLYLSHARSIHISLMLYGFIPVNLLLLPFSLCVKQGWISQQGLLELNRFLKIWYVFLVLMTVSLLFGIHRDLTFYNYPYELNFLLAVAAFFYSRAVNFFVEASGQSFQGFQVLRFAIPIGVCALVLLLHPEWGIANIPLDRPRGDNTLGMSLILLPAFYAAIEISAANKWALQGKRAWHWGWGIPLLGYGVSIVCRVVFENLSYGWEWFFQALTLLYIPLLLRWLYLARIQFKNAPLLVVAVVAFLLVDFQGNLFFAPPIRELFHGSDMIIGHAHLAIAVGMFCLSLVALQPSLPKIFSPIWIWGWVAALGLMITALTFAGLVEAGLIQVNLRGLWWLRSLAGALAIGFGAVLWGRSLGIPLSQPLRVPRGVLLYHLIGALSDGLGGMLLLLFGPLLYAVLELPFVGGYQYIVFGFVAGIGFLHWMAVRQPKLRFALARGTAWVRVLTAALFYALFLGGKMGYEAIAIGAYDLVFALVALVAFSEDEID